MLAREKASHGDKLCMDIALTARLCLASDSPTLSTSSPPTHYTSFVLQVVRYTALASGIVYGIVHRKTLQERFDKQAADKEVQQRARWLEEAKKAWEAQKLQGKSGGECRRLPSYRACCSAVVVGHRARSRSRH